MVGLRDPLRESAAETIRAAARRGIRTVILTGDQSRTANAIARQIGLRGETLDGAEIARLLDRGGERDRARLSGAAVFSRVAPQDKVRIVKALRAAGEVVAMAGDGINDAPALAQADVGLAIGTGTDVAIETADVTLMSGDLAGVSKAIRLSRATMNTIWQNLFWAFGDNVLLIPVAAGLLAALSVGPEFLRELNPMLAAFAMAFSSFSVVMNSLRLRGVTV